MAQPESPATQSTAPEGKAGGKAVASLICGICAIAIGSWCCFLWIPLGIVAMVLGKQEERAIAEGTASAAGKSMAQWGFWLGLIGIIIGVLFVLLSFVFGVFTNFWQDYIPNY